MWRDDPSLERATLMARWRRAAPFVHTARPVAAPRQAPVAADTATLLGAFEVELLGAVPAPMAEVLRGLLTRPGASFLAEPNAENRAKLLTAFDLLEDVLDALLLARSAALDSSSRPGAEP